MLREKLRVLADVTRHVRREMAVYRLVLRDPRTPRAARRLLWLALAYLALPFDLIPDWIPVLGAVDDLIIVPLLVLLALKRVPRAVLEDARRRADGPR